jgi:molybdate transport system ATP-binding protein
MTDPRALRVRLVATVGRTRLDVDLISGPGTLALVGPNGAGKSSLLAYVLGLRRPDVGRISVAGDTLLDTELGVDVPVEGRRIGYVPQDYGVFPHMTVRENVSFGLSAARRRLPRVERARCAETLLESLGIVSLADRSARTLSSGEKQRVAIARALASEPRALLLDEPLAALDVCARGGVRAFLASYLERLAVPTIFVTHDVADARGFGERVAVLEAGRVTQWGTWAELRAAPRSRFISEFVARA